MSKCFICGRRPNKMSNISFHRFPASEEAIQRWYKIIGKNSIPSGKRGIICSIHFTEDCFRYGLVYGNRRLKEGSIPSLYFNESEEETMMINKRHTSSVNKILEEVINGSRTEKSEQIGLNSEGSECVDGKKLKTQCNKMTKRLKESVKEESGVVKKKKLQLKLTWEQILSAPCGGKKYWESAQLELNRRKRQVECLQHTIRRTKKKLVELQTTINDLKENPFVAVYIQEESS